jgi:hypothetical protein
MNFGSVGAWCILENEEVIAESLGASMICSETKELQ